ncbi:MAG: lipocalin family protein [Planctomycetales bacterium]|nr:lipocalin family protein [Planctomycetales bacterium]
MKKIIIVSLIFVLTGIVGIVGIVVVGVYRFNFTNNDIYISGESVTQNDLVGAYIEQVSAGERDYNQGFMLAADGSAQSINMATLLYKSWRLENGKLYLTVESVGNGASSTNEEEYTIESFGIGNQILVLKKGDRIFRYKRKSGTDLSGGKTISRE